MASTNSSGDAAHGRRMHTGHGDGVGLRRVAAIGLDAASLPLIDELSADGLLPRLADLRRRSLEVPLTGDVAYRAELPWTRFMSGREAASNDYWSTVSFDPSTYEAREVGAHHAEPFYALDDRARVIAFDVPHTMLSERVSGVQVTAWGAHSPQYPRASHPAGLLTEIDERFGPHPAFDADSQAGWYHAGYQDALEDALLVGAGRRVDILQWLISKQPDWDLLVTVFSEPHAAGHQLWHGYDTDHPLHGHDATDGARERLVRIYRGVDAAVGRLLDALGDQVVVALFAVHGMQPNGSDVPGMFLVPEMLHRREFGRARLADPRRRPGLTTPPIVPRGDRNQGDEFQRRLVRHRGDDPRAAPAFRDRVLGIADRSGARLLLRRTRRRLDARLGRPTPAPWFELMPTIPGEADVVPGEDPGHLGSLDYQGPMFYRRWWPSMRVFALPTFSDPHLRVNLQGRERDGVVRYDDYDAELDRIEAFFAACRNPRTGRHAIGEMIRPPRDSPMVGPDADLVLVFAEPVDAVEHPELGRVGPVPFLRTGEHDPGGFVFVSGPGVRPDRRRPHDVLDLPPTLLELLGVGDSERLDGRPVRDVIT